MAGRPLNASRENALLMGDKTYIGTVHKKCGTDERYVTGGGCVHCARVIATEQREARKYLLRTQDGVTDNHQAALDSASDDGLTPAERFAQSIEDELM